MSLEHEIQSIIGELADHPEDLFQIEPRRFEEIVAELLAGFGWQISLTPPTRDGGYDILAIKRDESGLDLSYIVECKRYASDRKVGVDVLRSLYGVKFDLGLPNALLATTSSVTKDGLELVRSRPDIQVVDFDRLSDWLRKYKKAPSGRPYLPTSSFHSCFISYSHKDEQFAEKLYRALRSRGIKVWYAPEDVLPGKKLHKQIYDAIDTFDRLLVVLSPESMGSEWVTTEIRKARKREIIEGTQVLFPIGLASIKDIQAWECFDADSGKDLAVELREYLIPDFSNWQDDAEFDRLISKVVKSLDTDV